MLNDAIERAKQKHSESRKAEQSKRKSRPLTTGNFIQYFNDLYEKHDLGKPPPLNKDTKKKISGLIKVLKNNDYEDSDIYDFLDRVFEKWGSLRKQEIYTNNRKKYTLDDRPNLLDLINCRDKILNEVYSQQREQQEEKSLLEMWREDG